MGTQTAIRRAGPARTLSVTKLMVFMNKKNASNGNTRLESLLERQKQLDALVATEKLKLAKRKQRNDRKLFILVGEAVCEAAERSPEFLLMLKQTLDGTVTDAVSRRFLEARGYIA